MAPVYHVLFLKFSDTATAEDVAETCEGVLLYKKKCLHPDTQQPLIVSAVGGINCGTENLDGGFTHAFVLEFSCPENLQIYLRHEHHVGFDVMLEKKKILAEERVLDFSPGVF